MQTLNLVSFEELLDLRNRAEPVTIITKTVQGKDQMTSGGRADKETGEYPNRFFGKVYRVAERPAFIGANYESCVNLQREREEQPLFTDGSLEYFHAEELWKGKGLPLNKYIIQHMEHGELYIAYKPKLTADGDIINKASKYYWCEEDKPLTSKEVKAMETWFKPHSPMENQGVDKKVPWRTLKLCNLLQIKINKTIYGVQIESQRVA